MQDYNPFWIDSSDYHQTHNDHDSKAKTSNTSSVYLLADRSIQK
jgi:hypothetical protein